MIKKNILDLENIIKIKFDNKNIIEESLIHKSYDNFHNNEKLEFLGDRVLGLILAKTLLKIFPKEKEGIIDKKLASLVNKKTCADIAKKINIQKFMLLGQSYKKLKRSDEKIASDALEALIGAIYLDKGLNVAEKFILNYWREKIKLSEHTQIDSKTKLQEFSLKRYKILPKYKVLKESGPQHSPIFKVEVSIPNSKTFSAVGSSKKDGEQNAAKKLINELKI